MNEKDALRILEKAKPLIDDAVMYNGSFFSDAMALKAKETRREYKAAVRFLQREYLNRQSSNCR